MSVAPARRWHAQIEKCKHLALEKSNLVYKNRSKTTQITKTNKLFRRIPGHLKEHFGAPSAICLKTVLCLWLFACSFKGCCKSALVFCFLFMLLFTCLLLLHFYLFFLWLSGQCQLHEVINNYEINALSFGTDLMNMALIGMI